MRRSVASSDTDISILTDRINELAQQKAALFASRSRTRSPSRTQHARRPSRSAAWSPAPDICWYLRRFKEHAKRCTTACTWQQVTRKAVASGGQQLQQLNQPPLCERSGQQDEVPGRHRRRYVSLSPLPSARTPDSFQILVVCS